MAKSDFNQLQRLWSHASVSLKDKIGYLDSFIFRASGWGANPLAWERTLWPGCNFFSGRVDGMNLHVPGFCTGQDDGATRAPMEPVAPEEGPVGPHGDSQWTPWAPVSCGRHGRLAWWTPQD